MTCCRSVSTRYTGADMGNAHPQSVAVMEWFVDLHDNLLTGETGRQINAIGGALLCVAVPDRRRDLVACEAAPEYRVSSSTRRAAGSGSTSTCTQRFGF